MRFQKTWYKIKNFILLRVLGQQYRIQKEVKSIIKSSNNDINHIITEIQTYYNKGNCSLDELISRKFKLQNRNALEKNIVIPIFLGVFSSIIFYLASSINSLDSLIKLLKKDLYTIKTIVAIICAMILMMSLTVIVATTFAYLSQYVPFKNRCSKSYIYEKELEIAEKQIDIKRNKIPKERK